MNTFTFAARISYLAAQLLDRGHSAEDIIEIVDAPELENEICVLVDSMRADRLLNPRLTHAECYLRSVPAEFRLEVVTAGLRLS